MLTLDHIAVACSDLAEGTAWVEERLGVSLQTGGKHPRYGTHNTLLGLADGLYLEVIAIDPDAVPEAGHAWFGLDHFSGPPRLANWICQTDRFDGLPAAAGAPQALTRGELSWQITVPDDGALPMGGAYPTLIRWAEGTVHPATRLAPSGCRLMSFSVTHPQADKIAALIDPCDDRVNLMSGPFAMHAIFETPQGIRHL
ncbi:VOC family protein [Yoonia sp.]|uniref:VOC family protein n=1 Tax=Yoonia sp. TaxID=2212373 RepID=UPI002FD87C6F